MNCPQCKTPLTGNARFCGGCGCHVENAVPPPAPLPAFLATAPAGNFGAAAQSQAVAGRRLLTRMQQLLLSPRTEWAVIAPEPTGPAALYAAYVVPLAALAAVLGFIHVSVIGLRLPFAGLVRSPLAVGLTTAAFTFVMGLVSLFVVGLLINGLAPTFGATRDLRQALKVAAYAFTPGWLGALLALSPVLPSLLQFAAACYGIYLLYLGLPPLMRAPRERAAGYTATVVIGGMLFGMVLAVLAGVLGHFGAGLAGMMPLETPERQQQRSAQQVGDAIGGLLGTDEQGKAGLGAAIANLAKAGDAASRAPAPAVSATTATAPATDAPSPVAAVGGLLSALGGSLGGAQRVAPVDFKTLSALLPTTLAGMPRAHLKGEGREAIGVKSTDASADYTTSGRRAHVDIADVSGVSALMDLANGLVQNDTSESDAGYERNVVINGRSAHEKYDAPSHQGEISMLVARRFSVEVSGEGVPMSELEQAYGSIDLTALEALQDQGAQH